MPAPSVLAVHGRSDRDALDEEFGRRRRSLLRGLFALNGSGATIDFRLIAAPDPVQPSRGRVDTVIVVRVENVEAKAAYEGSQQLRELAIAAFPECDWEIIPAERIPDVLRPFDIRHIVRIARRAQVIGSGAFVQQNTAVRGFASELESGRDALAGVTHVAPFTNSLGDVASFCRLVILSRSPVALSVRLRPRALGDRARRHLDQLLADCRAMRDWADRVAPDGEEDWTALRDLAGVVSDHIMERRVALQHGAVSARIELASPDPIPGGVVAAAGELFTGPPGSVPASRSLPPLRFLAGGYSAGAAADSRLSLMEFQSLDLTWPDETTELRDLFDFDEAGRLAILPPSPADDLPGIAVRSWRRVAATDDVPREGTPIGLTFDIGVERDVRLPWEDRLRHTYVVGQTGTGKSTLLLRQILADIHAGHGVGLLDPHGDLLADVLERIPAHRERDVVLIDPDDIENPVALNPLLVRSPGSEPFVAQGMLDLIRRLVRDEHGGVGAEWMGPQFDQQVRLNLMLLMSDPERPASLYDLYLLFETKDHWKRWLPLKSADPILQRWVADARPQLDYLRQSSEGFVLGAYISSKFQRLIFEPRLRMILSQRVPTIDFPDILENRRILLVNLSKGALGESNSRVFGMLVLIMLLTATLERIRLPSASRPPFFLYLDEFQNVATSALGPMLSEGRKFGLGLTLAHQYLGQVESSGLVEAILGNVGSHVAFRVGVRDAERLEGRFAPTFSANDLSNLPNYHACVAGTFGGRGARPFSVRTVPVEPPRETGVAERVRALSRVTYGVPRDEAERRILGTEGKATPASPRFRRQSLIMVRVSAWGSGNQTELLAILGKLTGVEPSDAERMVATTIAMIHRESRKEADELTTMLRAAGAKAETVVDDAW